MLNDEELENHITNTLIPMFRQASIYKMSISMLSDDEVRKCIVIKSNYSTLGVEFDESEAERIIRKKRNRKINQILNDPKTS